MTEQNKRRWLIVAIVLSLVPPVLLVQYPSLVSFQTVTLYASAIVGYWGVVFLLWGYILGARAVMSLVFKDLAPVLSIHKWLGKYGSLVIFLHPFLTLFFYGESLLYPFLPYVNTQFERYVTLGKIGFFIMLLIWFTSALIRDRIRFRPWKYLHYLAYIALPFVLLHIPNLSSQYMNHAAVKVYFFSLVLAYFAITLVRLRSWLNLDSAEYTVVRHGKLTETDYLITLKPTDSLVIRPRQGQYVYLRLGLLSESHPFSVFNYDETTNELTVVYRTYGMYTHTMLTTRDKGTSVYVSGPYGEFMYDLPESQPVVYISGGIGVTPFADQLRRDNGTRDQWLFAANRTPESAVLIPWVKDFLGEKCVSVYSRVDETSTMEPGSERGYITPELLSKRLGDPHKYHYYVCGPPSMMRAMQNMLTELGVAANQVHSETFGW